MGVTKTAGLVPMKGHVIAADISRYLILPSQGFAYNPMRINIGSIGMSSAANDVIVSPDYVVFACQPDRCHPHFFNHLRRTRAWQNLTAVAGNGGVRIRIYYTDLANFQFRLPPLEEQRAIIAILDDADQELEALNAQRNAIAKQRTAIAEELISGRLRSLQINSLSEAAVTGK
jgi:type I restriction enzyme S subunit